MNIKTTTILVVIISFICCTTIKSQQIKEYYITCLESDFNHIYENYQKEIYIPISITYNGETISNARMRIRVDGSIVLPKKSLKVKLDNGNFDGVSVFNFNADYEDKSYVQSYITSRLMKESGTKCFNAEHVRLYLNDEYLGLYISVQNMDIYFLLNNEFNPLGNLYKATIDGASLSRYDNVFYHWEQKTGEGYREDLQQLIFQLDTISTENYKSFLQEKFDYDALINILAMNLLTRNYSTYYHNYYMFHDTQGSGKWYMFPWDLDKAFLSYEVNMPYYHTSKFWAPDNPVMELACFTPEVMFDINTRMDYLHQNLVNNDYISPWLDSLQTVLYDSVLSDETDNISSISNWVYTLNKAKNSFNNRYLELKRQFNENLKPFRIQRVKHVYKTQDSIVFNWTKCISPDDEIVKYRFYVGKKANLENSESTLVFDDLNDTVLILNDLSRGKYYYKVVAYTSNQNAEAYDNYNIFFVDNTEPKVMISEINYNSKLTEDSGDWIELYNNDTDSIDISDWVFSDNNDLNVFKFPKGTIMNPKSYLILKNNSDKFYSIFPTCNCCFSNFDFKLNNEGELLRLYNDIGRLVDSLFYLPDEPWPIEADGGGSSLELISPNLDNSLAINWKASINNGSPCLATQTAINTLLEDKNSKIKVFPNPITDICYISYFSKIDTNYNIIISDVLGNIVFQEQHNSSSSGFFTKVWYADSAKSGMYLVSLIENGSITSTVRLALIR